MGLYVRPVKSTDIRETPDDFFEGLDREFHFDIDVCALPENAKCKVFYTPVDDGLKQDWSGKVCWMNPPYSQSGVWMRKAFEESQRGAVVVCLVQSATDTKWWHDYAVRGEIRFVRGRLRFKNTPSTAPFPSALVIFGRKYV